MLQPQTTNVARQNFYNEAETILTAGASRLIQSLNSTMIDREEVSDPFVAW